MKKTIFILILFFGFVKINFAQDVKVNAVLDSSKIRIGEQVNLHLYVNYNANQKDFKLNWPSIGDTITGKIEVIAVSPIDTTIPDKSQPNFLQFHQKITISAYDSGYFAVPGFKFILNNDTNNVQFTPTLLLEVHTVPTDTSYTKVKQVKPIYDEKFNWKWYIHYLYWGIGLLVFILAIVLITRYFVKRNQTKFIELPKPKIPAHITALASLDTIKNSQIWKDGQIKEYYSSITDTIRLYLEERFGVFALESTTDEIMLAMRSQVLDGISKEKLQQLLQFSDLVKFAKMSAIESEHIMMLQNAYDFVNGTKREEVTINPETNQNVKNA